MFQEFEGMAQKLAAGGLDSMDGNQLQQHVQTAADTAQQNGNQQLAQQLTSLLQQYEANPEGLKSEIVNLIKNDPQILEQFAPEFKSLIGSL